MNSGSSAAYRCAAAPEMFGESDDAPEEQGPPKRCPNCKSFFPQEPAVVQGWRTAWADEFAGKGEEVLSEQVSWDCTRCGWEFQPGGSWDVVPAQTRPFTFEPTPPPVWSDDLGADDSPEVFSAYRDPDSDPSLRDEDLAF